ncbi:hypothetical protein COV92_00880 [Candidatus Uhrbacteria bacterium CG11_big_fil_rev_8_21_14_0_20_41_9]|nr:MAG: hypothetical protein COV92_00880 [Candidatus Uhrbacteria bacterium CG11_big_fil_rev_8_21_14_0_20_41_9]
MLATGVQLRVTVRLLLRSERTHQLAVIQKIRSLIQVQLELIQQLLVEQLVLRGLFQFRLLQTEQVMLQATLRPLQLVDQVVAKLLLHYQRIQWRSQVLMVQKS